MPASASDAWRRSSEIVRIVFANSLCSSAVYAAPWLGSVGKSIFVILQVLEDDGARDLVDLRARVGEDDAERLFLRARRLDRERRAEVDAGCLPTC